MHNACMILKTELQSFSLSIREYVSSQINALIVKLFAALVCSWRLKNVAVIQIEDATMSLKRKFRLMESKKL